MSAKTIAVVLAVIAVLLAGTAVIVVATRSHDVAMPAEARPVAATDIVALASDPQTRFTTQGAHVDNAQLATRLGLASGDSIIALSGVPISQPGDVLRVIAMNGTEIFAEIAHAGSTSVVRWKLTGELRDARDEVNFGKPAMPFPSVPPSPVSSPSPAAPDPVLDTIVRVDDTHVTMPHSTLEALLANPTAASKSLRLVPAVRNGVPDGFKLYAIRPGSFATRFGLANGDTLHAINGIGLTDAKAALDAYTTLRDATQVELSITRRGQPMSIVIAID